jgi:xylulokinase
VLGLSLYPVIDHPGAALGAAVIAAYGAEEIKSLSMINDYITLGPAVEPKSENVDVYKIAYEEWREFANVTTNTAHTLSERTRR